MTDRTRRLVGAVFMGVAIAGVVVAWLATGFQGETRGGDAWNYLAAGERLNAGHPLYALSLGDRPVVIVPPYWTVPLLAPPPIAVIWRPLALLGSPSMLVWGLVNLVATLGAVQMLVRRGGLRAAAAAALLALPLGLLALSGNVNGLVLLALVTIWHLRDRPLIVGLLLAFAIAMKLTPVVLVVWLLGARRWHAVLWTIAWSVTIGVASIAGAGMANHLDWLRSVPTSQPSPASLTAVTGVPAIGIAAVATVVVALTAWRANEKWAFAAAVVASALVTPALYFQAIGLLAAAVAPWDDGVDSDRISVPALAG
jgi:hypothetical protein